MRSFRIINQSTRTRPAGWQAAAADGLRQGLRHVAYAWGEYIWTVSESLHSMGFRIILVDELPEAPGALGYHDVDEHGPFIRIGLNPIFANGGDWFIGDLSVVSVIDHETKETVGDPAANRWANDARGVNWALELCDAVESRVYTVTASNGLQVSLSDFVFPDYFNPFAPEGTQLDYLGVLSTPFQIDNGGYAIRESAGQITQVFATSYPEWKKSWKHRGRERASWSETPLSTEVVVTPA